MAYKTEIQVKVGGLAQIKELEATLTKVNALQTRINKRATSKFVDIGRLSSETKALTSFNRELEKNVTLRERAQSLRPSAGGRGGGGGGAGRKPGGGVNRLESLALGAGFPLLFGGGAGQVLGGIAGSFVGTGFGGQILGSAIGGGIEGFITAAAGLGQALSAINPDLERLAQAIGAVGNEEARRLELLEELRSETEAFNVAQEELKLLVGQDGVDSLKEFGDSTTELTANFSRFITILQTGLAGLINDLGIFKLAAKGISDEIARQQAERSTDPRLVALREERETVDFRARQQMGGGPSEKFAALEREREIGKEMLQIQQQINIKRFEELQNLLGKLEREKKIKDEKLKQLKIEREAAAEARKVQEARVTDLKVQQSGVQIQLNQLANEGKIFQIRQQTAAATVELEQARFNAQLSTLQLQEAGLQRELKGLEEKEIRFERQRELINEIAENKVKQAEIENKVAKLQNEQAILQAEAAQQQIKFEVERINLQIEMVKLKAQEIEDDDRRAAKLREIAATERDTAALTEEMIAGGRKRLENAREIAKQNNIIADNILEGKLQSIEAERVEARRAVNARELAKATSQAANEAARLNSNMSRGGLGSKTTQTVSTSLPIDPDVRKSVIEEAGPFGYRSVQELVGRLEEAQKRKNARMARSARRMAKSARMSQPSSSSFASSSSYASRSSFSGGGGTATVSVKTGPVMQVENKRYVSMEDFESGLREVARSTAQTSRSYGSRRYGGIG